MEFSCQFQYKAEAISDFNSIIKQLVSVLKYNRL